MRTQDIDRLNSPYIFSITRIFRSQLDLFISYHSWSGFQVMLANFQKRGFFCTYRSLLFYTVSNWKNKLTYGFFKIYKVNKSFWNSWPRFQNDHMISVFKTLWRSFFIFESCNLFQKKNLRCFSPINSSMPITICIGLYSKCLSLEISDLMR